MKIDKSETFQYKMIERHGRRYFCLQQNLVVLAWILFFQKDTVRANSKPDSNQNSARFVLKWLRYNFGLFRMNLLALIIFVGYKYQLVKIGPVVSLPYYGQICLPVHKGYKIFDLRKRIVRKVFNKDVPTSDISREMEQLKMVSQLVFSPSLRRLNIAERWYEEDYVSGSLEVSAKAPDSETLLKKFCHDVVEPLRSLVLLRQPTKTNAAEHINDLMKILGVSRLSMQEPTVKDFMKVKSFLDSMVERIQAEGNWPISLVVSHGDFCPENMMNTEYGIKMIDWESAMYRSALFDFYSYFFYRRHQYKIPFNILNAEIKQALPIFISAIAKENHDISASLLHLEDVYRRLYYIERICMLVEREMTDRHLNILKDHILSYMEAFVGYEEIGIGIANIQN